MIDETGMNMTNVRLLVSFFEPVCCKINHPPFTSRIFQPTNDADQHYFCIFYLRPGLLQYGTSDADGIRAFSVARGCQGFAPAGGVRVRAWYS